MCALERDAHGVRGAYSTRWRDTVGCADAVSINTEAPKHANAINESYYNLCCCRIAIRRIGLQPAVLVSIDPSKLADVSDLYPPGLPTDLVVDAHSLAGALLRSTHHWGGDIACALDSLKLPPAPAGPEPSTATAPSMASASTAAPRTGRAGHIKTPGVSFPFTAVCIRTLPNDASKRSRKWTGTNPPYVTGHAMALLRRLGVTSVLLDLPSADREDDGGGLIAHRSFF